MVNSSWIYAWHKFTNLQKTLKCFFKISCRGPVSPSFRNISYQFSLSFSIHLWPSRAWWFPWMIYNTSFIGQSVMFVCQGLFIFTGTFNMACLQFQQSKSLHQHSHGWSTVFPPALAWHASCWLVLGLKGQLMHLDVVLFRQPSPLTWYLSLLPFSSFRQTSVGSHFYIDHTQQPVTHESPNSHSDNNRYKLWNRFLYFHNHFGLTYFNWRNVNKDLCRNRYISDTFGSNIFFYQHGPLNLIKASRTTAEHKKHS